MREDDPTETVVIETVVAATFIALMVALLWPVVLLGFGVWFIASPQDGES
jgi:hypothetical protein